MAEETQAEDALVVHPSTHAAVVAVMREIDFIAKGRQADQKQGGYTFRGIEELLAAVGPAFRRHGVVSAASTPDPPIISSYQTSGGREMNWVVLKVEVTLRGTDNPEDVIVVSAYGEAGDTGDKAMAKAYSVGYREALFKAFAVPVSGSDYDTESTADTQRATAAEKEAAAKASQAEVATSLGWATVDELDAAWTEVKAACGMPGAPGEWARAMMKGRTRKTLTPALAQEIEVVMANADGTGWKGGYEPPPPTSKGDDR